MDKKYKNYYRNIRGSNVAVNPAKNLTIGQTVTVLKRLRGSIAALTPLEAVDSTEIGNKYTECTWGCCTESNEIYAEPELHHFPKAFVEFGRSSRLQLPKEVKCPMLVEIDTDTDSDKMSGCFWRCRVFQSKHKTPNKAQALKLFDDKIEAVTTLLEKHK